MLASSCCALVSLGLCFLAAMDGQGVQGDGAAENGVEDETYSTQLLVNHLQRSLVPRVRPVAQEDLVPPFDPALGRRLPEIDLLSLVPARVRVEVDSGVAKLDGAVMGMRKKDRGKPERKTHCFSSALACSSGPPLARGTVTSAAQLRMCCPSKASCRSAAQPSV